VTAIESQYDPDSFVEPPEWGDVQPIALIGFDSPIARFFINPEADRCRELTFLDGSDRVATTRRDRLDVERPIESVIGLITWADLIRRSPEEATDALLAYIASQDGLRQISFVALCIVPFASFADADQHRVQFVAAQAGSSAPTVGSADTYAHLVDRIVRAGYACELVMAPMLLAEGNDEVSGYPSLLQKMIRMGRCVRDEVATKMTAYFTKYALRLTLPDGMQFNAATAKDIESWLIDRCLGGREPGAAPVLFLERLLSVDALSERLKPVWDMELRSSHDAAQLTSLDHLFNELVWCDQDCDFQSVQYPVERSRVRALTSAGLDDVAARLATKPCEWWECQYAPARNRDINNIPGLIRKEVDVPSAAPAAPDATPDGEPVPGCHYYEGGAGETVLMLAPIGVDAGHFASLIEELLQDHRLFVWPTTEREGAEQVTAIRTIFVREGIDHVHIFTWCSSSILAAMLIDADESAVRSLAMVAPGMGDESETDAYKRMLWLVDQLKKHPTQAERITAWSTLAFKQTGGPDLERYAAGSKVIKSPLQHHPPAFWEARKKGEGGPGQNTELPRFINFCVNMAEDSTQDMDGFRVRLTRYQGPVLAILGTHDHLTFYPGAVANCRKQERWALATFLGGNHYFILEHGPAVADLLRRFIRDGGIVARVPDAVRGQRFRLEGCQRVASAAGSEPRMDVTTVRPRSTDASGVPALWSSIS